MSPALRAAFADELQLAAIALNAGDHATAFRHFERAHILGQRDTWMHLRSHVGMLRVGWQRRDIRELFGQLTRLLAAALFSRIWVPVGNTGGANVSALRPMQIPEDLQRLLANGSP